ncbi:hypothetical protein C0995_013029 [Termitomyces sp. Mi166|nr:hypothetical protein C0995_013029 [Termitomyces sp. Mi166\
MTAFVIESYKNLKPDSTNEERSIDILVNMSLQQTAALVHISRQLANETNAPFSLGTAVLQVEGTQNSSISSFTPTYADFACNILWFLSLLSCLGCALAACLALQWARNFVQAIENYSLPADRGCIRTYLLRGIRRFNLKTVVDSSPMLLHTSLFLFLSGLFLFLFPVNILIGGCSLIIFITLGICYLIFTLLPLFYSDCPYHTPISRWCWKGVNYLRRKGHLRYLGAVERLVIPSHSTFAEAAHLSATQKSAERDELDSWAMQVAVNILDNNGRLLEFIKELCTSQNVVQKSHLASLMNNTDLPSRFTRIWGNFRTMMLEDRAEHIMLCLDVADKICRTQRYYARPPADGIVLRGHFDGEEHMAIAFAALVDFISRPTDIKLPVKIDPRDVKRRLGQYAFGILWRALSRLFQHARTLHGGVTKLCRLPNVSPTLEAQTVDPSTTSELWALTEVQKELTVAFEVLKSAQLEPMAKIYPFFDQIANGLVDRTREHLEGHPAFQTPAHDSAIEETISDYEDLLRHIHYLQFLALFHSASQCFTGELAKEPQWDKCHDAVVGNVKELSNFDLTARSQAKLADHLQLYFDHRLKWPYRGCRFTIVKESVLKSKDKKPELHPEKKPELHLENLSILLLSSITGKVEIKAIIDELKVKLKNDEKRSDPNEPGSKERMELLRRVTGTESLAKQYQQHARGTVIRIAEILDEAGNRTDTAPVSFL